MKNKEIAKKCGDSTILSGHRNIGSSEFKQMSFLGGCLRVRSLERSHRNHGNHRKDYFLVAYGKKSLEEIFNEIWPLARNQLSEFKRKYMSTWIVFLNSAAL